MAPPADLRDVDRAARARGRARPRRRRGRSRPRDHRDRRPHGQGRRAGAPVRAPEGLAASAADQPVRHRAAHVPRVRRRAARRRRREARGRARDAAAAGARREGARPEEAEVDRRLAAEDRRAAAPARRSCSPATTSTSTLLPIQRCWPGDPAPFITLPAVITHDPHTGRAQRRHVPDAGDRRPLDVHALADPQGRPRRLPRDRRARSRSPSRSASIPVTAYSASAPLPKHIDELMLAGFLQGRAGRARRRRRRSTSRCRRTPRSCSRATIEKGEVGLEGPFGDHTGYYTAGRAVPGLPAHGDHDAARRDLSVDRRRQAAAGGRVARQGDRADLPAGDPDDRARRSSTTTCRSPARSTTA